MQIWMEIIHESNCSHVAYDKYATSTLSMLPLRALPTARQQQEHQKHQHKKMPVMIIMAKV